MRQVRTKVLPAMASPLRRLLALVTSSLLLVSMNPTVAHGASGPPVAPPVVHGHGHHGGGFGAQYNHVPFNPFAVSSFTPARNVHIPGIANGVGLPRHGFQLDLNSPSASIVLGSRLFHGAKSVTVTVGGVQQTFQPGSQVTAAEFIAIKQVLSGGPQLLTVDDGGIATGGTFTMNSVASPRVTELVVPASVTALDYFSRNGKLGISGDLTNFGSIFGLSTNSRITSGLIFAKDITNAEGGVISTQLPSSLLPSIVGSPLSSVSLTLAAVNNINNSGQITSSRALTLATAYGSINNTPGTGGTTPVIKAVNDVNLLVGNGNLTNLGLVKSVNSNINIATPVLPTDINITATGGAFVAFNGNINVRDPSYSGANNINLDGGDYLSQNLNLYSGTGAITGNVGQVTGTVNSVADSAHLLADTSDLHLGDNIINGDPVFASTGSITISGVNTFTQNVSYLAQGNITGSNAQIIDTSPTAGSSQFSVAMIAGATLSTVGTVTTVTFTSNGGSINLSNSTLSPVIDTHSTTGTAGNVLLVAHASSVAGTGQVLLPAPAATTTLGIDTSSANVGAGTVTIIAGGNPVAATTTASALPTVQIGNIRSGGGLGGNVSITTAQPTASGVTFDSVGGGSAFTGTIGAGATNPAGTVVTGYINTSGSSGPAGSTAGASGGGGGSAGSISITAGTSISTRDLLALGGGGGGGAGGTTNGGSGGGGGLGANISVITSSDNSTILVSGTVNSSGGGGGGGGGAGSGSAGTGGLGGLAGAISLALPTTGNTIVTGDMLAADGGAGGAGGGAGSNGGGGGGGAFGAGGGGGGGGLNGGANNGAGGGGGAGFNFGGGGGGGGNSAANPSGGGAGGGFNGGGAGGVDGGTLAFDGAPGVVGAGGLGGSHPGGKTAGAGGASLGLPGAFGGNSGVNGSSVPGFNGSLATITQNNDITVSNTSNSIALGTTTLDNFTFGRIVTLPTPFMASGFVGLNQNITGTSAINIKSSGTSPILQFNNTTLFTPTLTLTSAGADIGTTASPILTKDTTLASFNSTLTINTGGATGSAFLNDTSTGSITFSGVSAVGTSGTLFVNASANTAAMNTASGAGNTLQGGTIVLVSNNNIGAATGFPANALQIAGAGPTNLTARALNGSVYLNSTAVLNLQSTTVGVAGTFDNKSNVDFEVQNTASTTNSGVLTGGTSGTGLVNMVGTTLTNTSTITGPTVTMNYTAANGIINTGTISATSLASGNLTITAQSVTNSGASSMLSAVRTVGITGQSGSPLKVTNAGTITGTSNSTGAVTIQSASGQDLTVSNSGTINASGPNTLNVGFGAGTVIAIIAATGGDLFVGGGGTMQAPNVAANAGAPAVQVTPILLQAIPNGTSASFVEFTGSQTFVTQAANGFATDPSVVGTGNFVFSEIPNLTVMVQANGTAASKNTSQSIIIDNNAQVLATNSLTLKSLNIAMNGTGFVTANQTLNYDFYDPNPAVNGNAVITVNGNFIIDNGLNINQFQSLAIIATGDILWDSTPRLRNTTNVVQSSPANSITLANPTGNAGNLTLIAGFEFDSVPNPTNAGGTVTPPQVVMVGGPSATGGSILLPGININTSTGASGFSGGNVIAIAYGSSASTGTNNRNTGTGIVELGSIDTRNTFSGPSPTGRGGFVQIIGSSVDVGSIQTSGPIDTITGKPATNSTGTVSVVSGLPQATSNTQIGTGGPNASFVGNPNNSIVYGAFQVQPGTLGGTLFGSGNIALNGPIAAPSSTVTVVTGGAGSVSDLPVSPITAAQLVVTAGTGGIGTLSANLLANVPLLLANATGNVYISDSVSSIFPSTGVTLNSSSGAIFQLTNPQGDITLAQQLSADTVVLTAGNTATSTAGSINLSAPIAGQLVGNSRSVTLHASLAGSVNDLIQAAPTVSTDSLAMTSGTGTIGSNTQPIQTNATTLQASTDNNVYINDVQVAPVTLNGTSAGTVSDGHTFQLTTAGALTVQGQVTATTVTFNANGGITQLVNAVTQHLTLNSINGDVSLPSATVTVQQDASGNGGSMVINGDNLLVLGLFPSTSSQAIFLNANGINVGAHGGDGGTVSLTLSASNPLTVGGAAGNVTINANSGSLGGNGGNVTVSNGGDLTVNPSFLRAAAVNGTGPSITLIAGNNTGPGNLLVTGALSANGAGTNQNGGNITLQSNSTTVMNIGLTSTTNINGVRGTLTVTGTGSGTNGNISITNVNGAVTNATTMTLVKTISMTAGGTGSVTVGAAIGNSLTSTTAITLSALGSGNVVGGGKSSKKGLITGDTVTLFSLLGTIGTSTVPLTFNANNVTANAPGTLGLANLVDSNTTTSATGVTIGPAGAASSVGGPFFSLSAASNITVAGPITASSSTGTVTLKTTAANGGITVSNRINTNASTGTVTLTALGTGSILSGSQAEQITAGTLNLSTTSGNFGSRFTPLQISAANLAEGTSGSVFIDNTESASAPTLSLIVPTLSKSKVGIGPTGTFFLESGTAATAGGPVTPGGNITQLVSLATGSYITIQTLTGGNITVEAALGLASTTPLTGTRTVTLFTGGVANSGSILQALPTGVTLAPVVAGQGVVLTSAGGSSILGPSSVAFLVATPSLVANAGPGTTAPVNVQDTSAVPVTVGNSGGQSFTLTTAAPTTLNYISAANGNVSVLDTSAVTTGASLQTAVGTLTTPGSVIAANNGSVTLQNGLTSIGSILLGANSVVNTTGTGGPVNIVLGPVPGSPVTGTTPANVVVNTVTTGSAFFGTNSITALAPQNTINLAGGNVVFSTGTQPATGITLGGGVSITADPMPSSGAPAFQTTALSLPASSSASGQTGAATAMTTPPSGGPIAGLPGSPTAASANLGAPLASQPISSGAPLLVASLTLPLMSQGAAGASSAVAQLSLQAARTNALVGLMAGSSPWISDTELMTGQIPAVVSSDQDLGLTLDESTVVELETSAAHATQQAAISPASQGMPLAGTVSKTVGSGKLMTLKRGSVVFAATVDTTIGTQFGKIKVDANSVVLVMSFTNGVAVYDLDDRHAGAVQITAAARTLSLCPGRHVVISPDSVKGFAQVNPAQLIGYRNIKSQPLGGGLQAFTAEFSMLHAMSAVMPLKQLMSSNHPNARKVAGRLLKTAAVVLQMNGANGSYQQVLRPALTAWKD